MQPPIDELQVRWHEHVTKELRERQELDPTNLVLRFDLYDYWIDVRTQIAEWHHNNQTETIPTETRPWLCPYCNDTFVQRSTMRRHVVRKHADQEPPEAYIPLRDSLQGLPQWRHCKIKVATRFMPKQHIEHRWYHAFDPEGEEQTLFAKEKQWFTESGSNSGRPSWMTNLSVKSLRITVHYAKIGVPRQMGWLHTSSRYMATSTPHHRSIEQPSTSMSRLRTRSAQSVTLLYNKSTPTL